MSRENHKDGRIIRAFKAKGDTKLYREELTYISDSDTTYSYRMLSGISDATSYKARLKIEASSNGSTISWHAELQAPQGRADEIANGTKDILDTGISAIVAGISPIPETIAADASVETKSYNIGNVPKLGLTVAPAHLTASDTICLFLHGIGGNRSNWQPQLKALGDKYPMVAMDLRGYGDSTLGFSSTTIDDYCADIREVAASFGARRVVLAGLSYGSWIATSFAMRYPEMLAGLILCGGCTGMSEADPDEREAFRISREVPMNQGQTPADFAPSVVDIISGPNASDDVRQALLASMSSIPAATYRDALECFCNPLETFDFGRIACPVLLLTGEHDRLAPPSEIRDISHRIHRAENRPATAGPVRFEVIANAGHVCNFEAPDTVNRYLDDFLKTLGLARPTRGHSRKSAAKAEKYDRIMNAALKEFAQNGYAGASMQSIAKAAGVSKPTLYQYIGQKEEMFAAILETGRQTLLLPFQGQQDAPLVPTLWEFSQTYADFVLSPDMLAIARVVIGEAGRVPDLAAQYHENGPNRAFNGIKRYLISQQERDRLKFDDPNIAAEQLWALILSGPRNHALHFPSVPIDVLTVERSVRIGLRVFITAYSTEPETDLAALAAMKWSTDDA